MKTINLALTLFFAMIANYAMSQCSMSALNMLGTTTTTLPYTLKWEDNCPNCYSYELQIMRLYNIDTAKKTPTAIKAVIDWDQATVLYIKTGVLGGNTMYFRELTLAEGTGYYTWRVRRIMANEYEARTDSYTHFSYWANGTYNTGDTVTVTTNSNVAFFYTQFDDDKNWVHKRNIANTPLWNTKGLYEQNEKIDYYNSLLMPSQHQEQIYYNWSNNTRYSVVTQSVPDYSGRPSLQTLKGTGADWLSYQPYWMKNSSGTSAYSAKDFDESTNYNNPSTATGPIDEYYSDANQDKRIANAEGRPYSRTLYYNDPLNRVKEISTPGSAHAADPSHPTSKSDAHTIRKFYGKPADNELVFYMGDEAPKSESVLKTYTYDPNGTINVTYTDEFGRTIATALTKPIAQNLDDISYLPDVNLDPIPKMSDTIENRVDITPTRIMAKGTYVFPTPTTLDYVYNLLIRKYKSECLNICATCDYDVTFTLKERDDTATYRFTNHIAANIDTLSAGCESDTFYTGGSYLLPTTTLDQGTYDACVYLDLNVKNPTTGKPYIDSVVSILHKKVEDGIVFGANLLPSGTGYLDVYKMRQYALNKDFDSLSSYISADTSKPFFYLSFPQICDTITLPTIKCKSVPCDTPLFAEYMLQKLMDDDIKKINNSSLTSDTFFANVYTSSTGIGYITDTSNLFLVSSNLEFNNIIKRMIADGYDCNALWSAWTQTVNKFIVGQKGVVPAGTTILNTAHHKYDWWQDFMNLVGYKFPYTRRAYSELFNPTDSVRLKPYKFFPYDWGTDTSSENIFCYLYNSSIPCSVPGSPPGWVASINNFTASDPATENFHMFNFYKRLKNNGPNANYYFSSQTLSNAINFANTNQAQAAAKLKTECYSICDGRKNATLTAITNDYMQNHAIKVEGQYYNSTAWGSPVDSIPLTKLYCLTNAIIDTCKKMCDVTSDSAGVISSTKANTIKKAMFGVLKVQTFPVGSSEPCAAGYNSVSIPATTFVRYDVLDWLNSGYSNLLDSLRRNGAPTYRWYPFKSLYSLATIPLNTNPCDTMSLPIPQASISGATHSFFHFGKPIFRYDPICSSNDLKLFRMAYDSTLYGSETEVKLYISVNMGANDSVVLVEKMPNSFTYVYGEGVENAGVMRYVLKGARTRADSFQVRYTLKAPSSSITSAFLGKVYIYRNSATPSDSCYLGDQYITARPCLAVKYVKVVRTSYNPWIASDSSLCTNVCADSTSCSGRVCIKWDEYVDPDNPDTTQRFKSCGELTCASFVYDLDYQLQKIHDRYEQKLRQQYADSCMNKDYIRDQFVNQYWQEMGIFTLYLYDRAGNLIRTVAPNGTRPYWGRSRLEKVTSQYRSEYDYNTLGQLLRQETTDGGETRYWYDKLGQLRFSQNAKQNSNRSYSYTKFDKLGRITETGEIQLDSATTFTMADTTVENPLQPLDSLACHYVNKYVYGDPYIVSTSPAATLPYAFPPGGPINGDYQTNITNRLSYVMSDKDGRFSTVGDQSLIVYSYDPHGNVVYQYNWVYGMAKPKLIEYGTDAIGQKNVYTSLVDISGNPDPKDSYGLFNFSGGMNGQLTQVFTFANDGHPSNPYWKKYVQPMPTANPSARKYVAVGYQYSCHDLSQVRRMELGYDQQGVDYTYTLEGWLKGINHPDSTKDLGMDLPVTWDVNISNRTFTDNPDGANSTSQGRKDLFSEVLHYYDGDFRHAGAPYDYGSTPLLATPQRNLYNGNISAVQSKIYHAAGAAGNYLNGEHTVNHYKYDQLNRLDTSRFEYYDRSLNNWVTSGDYDEYFRYDLNGNFQQHGRWAYDMATASKVKTEGAENHGFTYAMQSNRLMTYRDDTTNAFGGDGGYKGIGFRDLDDTLEFTYTANGELATHKNTLDAASEKEDLSITWTPYGKVESIRSVIDNFGNTVTTNFLYDAYGNRIRKEESTGGTGSTEYYVNTADGKILANYLYNGTSYGVTERHVYGHDHVGIIKNENTVTAGATPQVDSLGETVFELKDHLGNTRVTFGNYHTVPYPDAPPVLSYSNYYAYGSLQPFRAYNAANYRMGFNGQEKDDNILGTGNLNTAKFWEYDTRLGRRWNIDPKPTPGISDYSVFRLNPSFFTDLLGDKVSFASPVAERDFYGTKSNVDKRISKLDKQIANAREKGKNRRVDKLADERTKLASIQQDFNDIINSDVMFFYESLPESDNPNESGGTGSTSWDFTNNRMYITYHLGAYSNATLVHENGHGSGFLKGEWSQYLDENGNIKYIAYDYWDEMSGFMKALTYDPAYVNKLPKGVTWDENVRLLYSNEVIINEEFVKKKINIMVDPNFVNDLLNKGRKVANH